MTSTAKGSSQNAFLSLRARLRTPECSTQQFSGRVARATHLDGGKIQEHLQCELRKVLAAHLSPEKQGDGISVGQNYALLEQLANSLATTGSKLHHQSTREIENVNEAIQSQIDDFSFESNAALAKSAKLYQIIAQPLAELAEPSADEQEDTVLERMALLHGEFTSANDKIETLHEQWQSCVRAEQEAWMRLTDADNKPREELQLQDFVDSIDEVMLNGESKINDIDAEYAEYIQVESLKVMQTLMEG
ncbi:hypothetical protein LMH87_000042 [Akanthomyces muscarius]|uniref:Uncharacterized protein n=1 Tax=Akanthomyces muscarius TaxID=2231603 RepID=A0A9W8QGJ5_AKAMU|nr:hypothetical protein LMH87_000042 [Akanthomyces muscarius]KAJ4154763.1 hypothetical protein LMH87_000042 [Akanthomyces muscarius]